MQTANLVILGALAVAGCATQNTSTERSAQVAVKASRFGDQVQVVEKACLVWPQKDLMESILIEQAAEANSHYSLVFSISPEAEHRLKTHASKLAATISNFESLEIKLYLKPAGNASQPNEGIQDSSKFVRSWNIKPSEVSGARSVLTAQSRVLDQWYRIDTKLNVLSQEGFLGDPFSTDDCLYQTVFVRLGKLGFFDVRASHRFYIGREPH